MRRPRPHGLPRRALGLAALVLPLACAAGDSSAKSERTGFTFAPTRAVLLLIPAEEADQLLAQYRPAGTDPAGESETELARACSGGESQITQRGLLPVGVANAWHILMYPLAVAVHDELQKYATVSEARASGNYYRGAAAHGMNALTARISCVRFVRFATPDPGADEVALDFVASVQLDPQHDALRLRPLRLYIAQAGAKSVNGRYSVAISLGADAVWRDEVAGHEGAVFEHTVATEVVDLKTSSYLRYYPPDDPGMRVAVIPTSFGIDRSRDFGQAEFTVRVVELGTAPATLRFLADMLPDPAEKTGQLLIAAALSGSSASK